MEEARQQAKEWGKADYGLALAAYHRGRKADYGLALAAYHRGR